ncbi:MAG: hypothetical protein EOO69_04670 [Moraxellaceae bacterium]|nr:MAG: hypothetical protein EOO69_04670 [Moraxellaceae bacterium]
MKYKYFTIGQLKQLIADLPDDMLVLSENRYESDTYDTPLSIQTAVMQMSGDSGARFEEIDPAEPKDIPRYITHKCLVIEEGQTQYLEDK